MKWKDFLRPSNGKIIIFLFIVLISVIMFFVSLPFGFLVLGTAMEGFTYGSVLSALVSLIGIIDRFLYLPILLFFDIPILLLMGHIFLLPYWYFLACFIVSVFF